MDGYEVFDYLGLGLVALEVVGDFVFGTLD